VRRSIKEAYAMSMHVRLFSGFTLQCITFLSLVGFACNAEGCSIENKTLLTA